MRKGYDTIYLFLSYDKLPVDYCLTEYLEDVKTYHNKNGEFIYSMATIDNLRVILNRSGLRIQNSFCNLSSKELNKSYLGKELRVTIKELNDLLGVDLFKAKVTRLDFYFDIITKYYPNTYLNFFGDKNWYKTLHQENGKYYLIKKRRLVIYNKSKQLKIEDLFILRYEIRFLNRISEQFKITELIVENLCCNEFIKQIEKIALEEYHSIEKIHNVIFKLNKKMNLKQIDTVIYKAGIKSLGLNKIIESLNACSLIGLCNATQKHRYKKKIHSINKLETNENEENLVDEIETKLIELVSQD